ncbi:MAG: ion channel [Parvularculaceae bacterium]|nr:hypothetical protein [Parvularculaceae bacterium]
MLGQFSEEFWISVALIGGTVFFHAVIISSAAAVFRASKRRVWGPARFVRDALMMTVLGIVLMAAHVIEMAAWALTFMAIGIYDTFEPAFYFSAVSYTTLGFGDVLLPLEWRLLAGAVAADGLLLFGLSAAFLVETAAKLRLGGDNNH